MALHQDQWVLHIVELQRGFLIVASCIEPIQVELFGHFFLVKSSCLLGKNVSTG